MEPKICHLRTKNGIFCAECCDNCGFNPAEQRRRIKEGHFQYSTISHTLHDDNNRPVHTVTNMCKTLFFKKGE